MNKLFAKIKEKMNFTTTFTRSVALPGLLVILLVSFYCGFFPDHASVFFQDIQSYVLTNLSWTYVLIVTLFVLFLIVIALSKLGNIKLGADDSRPKYSFFSWIAFL